MKRSLNSLLEQFIQPQYTGENRCFPCTVLNALIAIMVSGGVAWLIAANVSTLAGAVAGLLCLAGAVTSIAFRGYLVPGTPALTKRYLPRNVRVWFGDHELVEDAHPATGDGQGALESTLVRIGVLQEDSERDSLTVNPPFRADWYDAIDAIEGETDYRHRLERVIGGSDEAEVGFTEYETTYRAKVDGRQVGLWPSEAALRADLGAAEAVSQRWTGWKELGVEERGQLLSGIRLYADRCPNCHGRSSFGTERVESCCSMREVAAVSCEDCGTRLFETPI